METSARRRRYLRMAAPLIGLLMVASGCEWITRASTDAAGGDANADSGPIREVRTKGGIALSGTGQVVVFESAATDLLRGGNAPGLFLRDVVTGGLVRLSSGQTPAITPDGRYVAYADQAYGTSEVRVLDRSTGTTTVASVRPDGAPAGSSSINPAISADGRFVAFESPSTELVAGFTGWNVFVRDLVAGTTEVVSASTAGTQADGSSYTPTISADGRFVAFSSWATDLMTGGTPTGFREVFLRDRLTASTTKVSVDNVGTPLPLPNLQPSISGDGRHVAFEGHEAVYVRDTVAGTTTAASVPTGGGPPARASMPSISADGRTVVFASSASTLVPNDTNGATDVFAHDMVRGTTLRVSVTTTGEQRSESTEANLMAPTVSADGHHAAFATDQALVADDTNAKRDVYVRVARRPLIDAMAPMVLTPGSTATLVVTGDGFLPGAGASVNADGPGGVTVTGVDVDSSTQLRIHVTVDPDAQPGPRSTMVWNRPPDPGAWASAFGVCIGCTTVS